MSINLSRLSRQKPRSSFSEESQFVDQINPKLESGSLLYFDLTTAQAWDLLKRAHEISVAGTGLAVLLFLAVQSQRKADSE